MLVSGHEDIGDGIAIQVPNRDGMQIVRYILFHRKAQRPISVGHQNVD